MSDRSDYRVIIGNSVENVYYIQLHFYSNVLQGLSSNDTGNAARDIAVK